MALLESSPVANAEFASVQELVTAYNTELHENLGLRQEIIKVGDQYIDFLRTNEDLPVAIYMLHGGFHDHNTFAHIMRALANAGIGSAAINMPGTGGTTVIDGRGMRGYLNTTARAYDYLNGTGELASETYVMGHSIGGSVGYRHLAENPDLKGAILLAPVHPFGVNLREAMEGAKGAIGVTLLQALKGVVNPYAANIEKLDRDFVPLGASEKMKAWIEGTVGSNNLSARLSGELIAATGPRNVPLDPNNKRLLLMQAGADSVVGISNDRVREDLSKIWGDRMDHSFLHNAPHDLMFDEASLYLALEEIFSFLQR